MNLLPSLPTDRLFKVQAFAGLAIVLWGLYFVLTSSRATVARAKAAHTEASLIASETEILLKHKQHELSKPAPSARVLDSLDALLLNLDRREAQYRIQSDAVDRDAEEAAFEEALAFGVVVIGIFVARRGFRDWRRAERALDPPVPPPTPPDAPA